MKKHKLDTVFIATDADGDGDTQICFYVYDLSTFSSFLIMMAICSKCDVQGLMTSNKQFYYPLKFV